MTMRKTIILTIACMCPPSARMHNGAAAAFRSERAVQERAGRDAGLRTRDELPPCVGVLCQRLPAMGRVRILQACMPEIFLAELPYLRLRRGLQTLRHEGRNHYGSLRIGASGGSDTRKFLVGLHFGYEHNYVLRAGWTLYWQVKGDVMIKGADVLRTGVALGIKLPIK